MKEARRHAINLHMEGLRWDLGEYKRDFQEEHPCLFDGQRAPLPRRELLEHCKVLPDRHDILRELPKGGRFAEVGTQFGGFAVKAVELSQPHELHLFDLTFQNITPENTAKLDSFGAVFYHEGDSPTKLAMIPDAFFDVVYVDGDHSYEGVWKDLVQALRILKPNGFLICNDYCNWDVLRCLPYGVFDAVNRFAAMNNLYFTHMGLHPLGFHDVAMRRVSARA